MRVIIAFVALATAFIGPAISAPMDGASVHEVTIAAPDIVRVEVREKEFTRGSIVEIPDPAQEDNGAWATVAGQTGIVIGRDKRHLRTADSQPGTPIDREVVDRADQYGPVGGRKVQAVYRKSLPFDVGIPVGTSNLPKPVFKHFVYLKLDGPLAPGQHTIVWPSGTFSPSAFTYDERSTRSDSIRVNQAGYRGTDDGKIAYLSLWLPGGPENGAVDFRRYGIKDFEVVDSTGKTRYRAPIVLRTGPQSKEPGNGLPNELAEYPSTTARPVRITAISGGSAVTVTAPGHGVRPGDRIWLEGLGDAAAGFNGFATVDKVMANSFTIASANGSQLPKIVPGYATVRPAYKANRSGTYTFGLDFGGWRPEQAGEYRIVVPGIGASDPFAIADDTWLRAALTSFGGLYNQRSGVELDGRFGFKRPAAFAPGKATPIRLSKLPFAWSGESTTGFISFENGAEDPWITSEPAPDGFWGGYMDAGDWDRRSQHLAVSRLMLDLFEALPPDGRHISLGLPPVSQSLGGSLYASEDGIPDLVGEAIWNVDFFRRLQLPDGNVRGAIESAASPTLGEPSYLEHHTVFAYAPDHVSTYHYAALAAQLSRILREIGKDKLADVYEASATKAWSAAEKAYADPDAYYAEAIRIGEKAGIFGEGGWKERRETIQAGAREMRTAAAASLFRSTGKPEYRSIFEKAWTEGIQLLGSWSDAAWDYHHARQTTDPAMRDAIAKAFASTPAFYIGHSKTDSYINLKNGYAPMGWGQGLVPDYNAVQHLVRAHQLSRDPEILKLMEQGSAHILGANQAGLSFTTGIGRRSVSHPLHMDHLAMGVAAPPGITIYGWAPVGQGDYGWLFGPDWAPFPEQPGRPGGLSRSVEPYRLSMPLYEQIIEHPLFVIQQEYTAHQTQATTAALWLYLHFNRS